MIKPISRKEIFHSSVFADNFIASVQQSYATDIDWTVDWEVKHFKRYYDHSKPFTAAESTTDHCVVAYPAITLAEYNAMMAEKIIQFLTLCGCTETFLMDFIKTDLNSFPFETFRKKNQFKLFAGNHPSEINYQLDRNGIRKLFPLFFSSRRYDIPVIYLLTANGPVHLALNLCDDGNLHLNFHTKDRESITKAAEASGFIVGDIDLCHTYYINRLR